MTVHCANPGHPVSQMMSDPEINMPTKFMAILAWKAGGKLEITEEDIQEFSNQDHKFLVTQFHMHAIELRVVTMEEGMRIAKDAGGVLS